MTLFIVFHSKKKFQNVISSELNIWPDAEPFVRNIERVGKQSIEGRQKSYMHYEFIKMSSIESLVQTITMIVDHSLTLVRPDPYIRTYIFDALDGV